MIEIAELQEAVRKAFPPEGLERETSWRRASEMGLLLVDLPEELGGLGLGAGAAAAILFEMGKVLANAPLASALLGLRCLAAAPACAARGEWIERVAAGTFVPLNMLPAAIETNGNLLSGRVPGLFDADLASHCLVGGGNAYRLVPIDARGATLVEQPLWDDSRRLFDLLLDRVPVDETIVLATGADAAAVHDGIARSAHLFVAADSLGGANAALELSVDYLKLRRQFDRPLAMFQALKHRCADLKTALAAAEALFWSLAAAETAPLTGLGAMKGLATDAYRLVTEEAIQLHGGIGLTSEHPVHRYMKRAMLNLQLCGSLDHWREAAGRAAMAEIACQP